MKILIFGVGGMIGHRVWIEARKMFDQQSVFGILRRSPEDYQHYKLFNENIYSKQDAADWSRIEEILNICRPDIIINAIGVTIRKTELANFDKALEINSLFPRRLLKWGQKNKCRVIQLSTDCVFDGRQGNYDEASNPSAKDMYGKSKFLGEIEGEFALTLRFSCIGRELDAHTELLDWFLAQNGKKLKAFHR